MGVQRQASHNNLPGHSWTRLFPTCIVFIIAFIVYTPVLSSVTNPPPSDPEIRITHKIQNGNAILSCIVRDLGRRRIIWSRLSDPYPIAVGTTRFHPDSKKYSVSNEAQTNILTINNVGVQDAGEYQCLVSGGFPLKEVISLNIKADRKTTYFIPRNRSIISSVDLDVVLPCSVENINNKMVLWKDGRNNVVSLRKRIYNGDRRLKVLHTTRPQWDLQIKKLKKEDFGFYTCIVNSNPVLTRTIELIDNEPPKVAPLIKKDTHYRKKIIVNEGDTVTMTCNFFAYPPATVKWYLRYKDNSKIKKKDLKAKGNDYTLQAVSVVQAGDYICIGRNGMKKEGKARTRLIVNAAPTTVPTIVSTTRIIPSEETAPSVYHDELKLGIRRGRNAELKCYGVGWPRPNMQWWRQGARVLHSHKYKVSNKNVGRYTMNSTLLIRSVSKRDFGLYRCAALNKLGYVELNLELYDNDPQ